MTLHWNPSPIAFEVPLIHWPIYWYGLFFAFGLLLSASLCTHLLKRNVFSAVSKTQADLWIDRLYLYGALCLLIGARLFHVLFYDLEYYLQAPSHILSVWEGGLASHGGALGVLVGTYLFYRKYQLKEEHHIRLLSLFDALALAAFPAAVCIRIGNFFNQEIVGLATTCWTGVYFEHPMGLEEALCRHPVQLYEAISYLIVGLLCIAKSSSILKRPGLGLGLVLTGFFSARFVLEFFKTPQSLADLSSTLSTGQELSLPMIAIGLYLLFFRR